MILCVLMNFITYSKSATLHPNCICNQEEDFKNLIRNVPEKLMPSVACSQ